MAGAISRFLKRGREQALDLGDEIAVLTGAARRRRPSMAPAVALAAGVGVGVAFWWWTQWAKGAEGESGPETQADADSAPAEVAPVVEDGAKAVLDESLGVQAESPSRQAGGSR